MQMILKRNTYSSMRADNLMVSAVNCVGVCLSGHPAGMLSRAQDGRLDSP